MKKKCCLTFKKNQSIHFIDMIFITYSAKKNCNVQSFAFYNFLKFVWFYLFPNNSVKNTFFSWTFKKNILINDYFDLIKFNRVFLIFYTLSWKNWNIF